LYNREPLIGHEGQVTSLAFSPKENLLLSGGTDKKVIGWELKDENITYQKILYEHEGTITSVAFHDNGEDIATGSSDRTVKYRNLNSDFTKEITLNRKSAITKLKFYPKKLFLAIGCANGDIYIWELNNIPRADKNNPKRFDKIKTAVKDLSFIVEKENEILIGGHESNEIVLWDIKRNKSPKIIQIRGDFDSIVYPFYVRHKTLYTGSHLWNFAALNDERWDEFQVNPEYTADILPEDGVVNAAFNYDGSIMAVITKNKINNTKDLIANIIWRSCKRKIMDDLCTTKGLTDKEIEKYRLEPIYEDIRGQRSEVLNQLSCI